MAKSKAQRMREYRERKKAIPGDRWLKLERERVKQYRVPMSETNSDKKEHLRRLNRIRLARYRAKKRNTRQHANNDNQEANDSNDEHEKINEPKSSSDENVVSSTSDMVLTVKLPFSSRSSSKPKKRVSRALARSYRRIETLQDKNEELAKKLKTAQRRIQRYESKKIATTPRSKSDKLLKEYGLKAKDVPEIKKRLVFSECLSEEIRQAKVAQRQNLREVVHKVASGKVIKKYRMKALLEKSTSLDRRKSYTSKTVSERKKSRMNEYKKRVTESVVSFLERDDNSRMLPGKKDGVKCDRDKEKVQKRVLNDYMYNLHLKFLQESSFRISKTCFYKARPKHISLVNFASRSVCLCSRHQNFSFLLRALKSLNVNSCTNPDKFVDIYSQNPNSLNDILQKIPDEDVKFQQWKRVKLKNGKERQRVVEVSLSKEEFIERMMEAFKEFESHIKRVKEQYSAIKVMKDKLPPNHVLIQMDFSENYTCKTLEEIQSAYWNSSMVTLHPAVIYFRGGDKELTHDSYVYVSEVLSHNAAMVMSIIDKLMNVVKALVPELECVHFWTDSPSSQYRNKTIFDMVSRFPDLYGTFASWQYFESGHGKGPCDGIGGTTKRNADNAVKQGKIIQDATDFYSWATLNEKGIKYDIVTEEEYEIKREVVEKRNNEITSVKGTMMLHSVVGIEDGKVAVRNTTCACKDCFTSTSLFNVQSGCGWEEKSITTRSVKKNEKGSKKSTVRKYKENRKMATDTDNAHDKDETPNVLDKQEESIASQSLDVSVGNYVVVQYDEERFCGRVIEIKDNGKAVRVNFMQQCEKVKGKFKWPVNEDADDVESDEILRVIEEPVPTSKTGRMFTFPEYVLNMLEN